MRLDTTQHMRQEMRMKLAPRMIQSMEILQLPVMALQQRIKQELEENFTLLEKEFSNEESEGSENAESTENAENAEAPAQEETNYEEKELVVDDANDNQEDFGRLDSLDMEEGWDNQFDLDTSHRPSRSEVSEMSERKHDAMQNMASRPQTLHDYLFQQFSFLDCSGDISDLASFIIYNLDDSGFLKTRLEEIVLTYGQGTTLEKAQQALQMIQLLDPPGVGARDLGECLLLQINPDTPFADEVRTIVSNHLDDVKQNRLPLIQKRTGFSMDVIHEAIDVLKTLKLRPGSDFISDNVPNVVPDLLVEESDDGYKVRLEDEYLPNVFISRKYQRLLRDRSTDPKVREFIQRKIQSARWLIDSIEQRRSTITKVAQAIIDHQSEFVEKGPEHIQPLKMQEIADKVGVHVTTVSRAVDDKWIQTPRGIFPLKRFFGGGTKTDSGQEVAWEIVQQKLQEVIDEEDKTSPLSDDDIVKQLAHKGFTIARRTVTKYRKKMGIPSSRQRRQFV